MYQTRKQELSEIEYSKMSEDEKRLYQRNLTKKGNYLLNQTAKKTRWYYDRYYKKLNKSLKDLEKENKKSLSC